MNPHHGLVLTSLFMVWMLGSSLSKHFSQRPLSLVSFRSLRRGYYGGEICHEAHFLAGRQYGSRKLEPAFESLLRSLKVNDAVIDAMRLNEITDRAIFTDLPQDENQLKKCAKLLVSTRLRMPSFHTSARWRKSLVCGDRQRLKVK